MEKNRKAVYDNKVVVEQYLKKISQHLCCAENKKMEIIKDLESDIRIAMENGEDWDTICERMGTPEEVAAEFNENFSDSYMEVGKLEYRQADKEFRKKKMHMIIGSIVAVLCLVLVAVMFAMSRKSDSDPKEENKIEADENAIKDNKGEENANTIGIGENQVTQPAIYGNVKEHFDYDKEAVIEQTKVIISLIEKGEYETLRKDYTAQMMMDYIEQSQMDAAKDVICDNWGEFRSYGNFYTNGLEQGGVKVVVVQVNVSYENANVSYAITLDEEMKLAGIYMK